MRIVFNWLECKAERDQTCTEGMFSWYGTRILVYRIQYKFLYWIRCVAGGQSRVWTIGWMFSVFVALHVFIAAAFWTFRSLSSKYWRGNLRVESYNSITERGQENKQRSGFLKWWGVVGMFWSMNDFLPGCLFAVVVIKCFMIGVNVWWVCQGTTKHSSCNQCIDTWQ